VRAFVSDGLRRRGGEVHRCLLPEYPLGNGARATGAGTAIQGRFTMMHRCALIAGACMLTLLQGTVMADTININFDQDQPGSLPTGWKSGVTGRGSPKWAIEKDNTAPSPPNVLKQSGSGTFPWCIKSDTSIENGSIEVKFKPISGREDAAGGLIWRWKDGDNYYVARANA